MQSTRNEISVAKDNYQQIVTAFLPDLLLSNSALFADSKLNEIMKNFESRIRTCHIYKALLDDKPIIVDIGCGDFPHFFLMTALFPNGFTYFGVDKYPPVPESENPAKLIGIIKEKYPNFHFNQVDLLDGNQVNQLLTAIVSITGKDKVDLVLVEHLAVGGSDNLATDELMKRVIQFVPLILSESGLMHIEAASNHQRELVSSLLQDANIPYIETDAYNFSSALSVKVLENAKLSLPRR